MLVVKRPDSSKPDSIDHPDMAGVECIVVIPATETIVDVVANADSYDALIIYSCLAGLEILDAWADTKLWVNVQVRAGSTRLFRPIFRDWS